MGFCFALSSIYRYIYCQRPSDISHWFCVRLANVQCKFAPQPQYTISISTSRCVFQLQHSTLTHMRPETQKNTGNIFIYIWQKSRCLHSNLSFTYHFPFEWHRKLWFCFETHRIPCNLPSVLLSFHSLLIVSHFLCKWPLSANKTKYVARRWDKNHK